jgi:thiamine-phosphate pyrophosphorylase
VRPLPGPLLVITDRHQARHSIENIAAAVGRGGGRWLLLRDKDLAREERWDLAARLARIASQHGIALSVSTDVELAAAIGAAGIHLQAAAAVAPARRRLGPTAIIGVSAHALADVAAAADADYVTLSPIFLTGSKPGYGPALGVAALHAAAASHDIPVLALGGVTADTAGGCLAAGARGIAVMGEVMRADDPGAVVAALTRACQSAAP